MKIAIIDADLIGRKNHRFPNLACMKISGYYKSQGHEVVLKLNYFLLHKYDKVFISKVFTDTPIKQGVLDLPNVEYGGTGFFYDKAPKLPCYIEHSFPDYHLYDKWVESELKRGVRKTSLKFYTDYSIGFTTRGCFRQCQFCVNRNYKKVELHSPLSEFYDESRPKICLLDDNILGHPQWKEIFESLIATNKPFQCKQGMDERLLTDEKCEVLAKCKYDGDYIFAFDSIEDKDIIIKKLELLRKWIPTKNIKFYVFCAFDRQDKWDYSFWRQDIIDIFERLTILGRYRCLPYLMRFKEYENSPFRGIYITLAAWCNQPKFFRKSSFSELCRKRGINRSVYEKYKDDYESYVEDGYTKQAPLRYLDEFTEMEPEIVNKYFNKCLWGESLEEE